MNSKRTTNFKKQMFFNMLFELGVYKSLYRNHNIGFDNSTYLGALGLGANPAGVDNLFKGWKRRRAESKAKRNYGDYPRVKKE